jgi:signal transduction histidine kinase
MPSGRRNPSKSELLQQIEMLQEQLAKSIQAGRASEKRRGAADRAGRRAEDSEAALRGRLRALAASASLTEERERRRIAVEIHDRISQKLALCKMQLSGVKNSIAPGSEGVLQGVLDLLAELLEDTRRLTFELSPPILYELGFVPAIEWLAEQFQQAHKVKISVESERRVEDLPNDLRVLLFQCTRELLNNVVKHSHATRARIALTQTAPEISLSVTDDGVGFDEAAPQVPVSGDTSFGLFSIRQRVEEIGGFFNIQSRTNTGTIATITIPLEAALSGPRAKKNADESGASGGPKNRPPARKPGSRPASTSRGRGQRRSAGR